MVGSPSWIIGVNILALFLAFSAVVAVLVYARALGRLVWVISETEKALERDEEEDGDDDDGESDFDDEEDDE